MLRNFIGDFAKPVNMRELSKFREIYMKLLELLLHKGRCVFTVLLLSELRYNLRASLYGILKAI